MWALHERQQISTDGVILVLATWDIRSKIRGARAMWKTLLVMWIKRKRHA
jgi:hypothetical protein